MTIKRGKLEFHNVIGMKTKCLYEDWEEEAQKLRTFIVNNDLFITGPVILKWDRVENLNEKMELTIHLPLYNEINIEDNDTFFFEKQFLIEDGLKIRHLELEDDMVISETILEQVGKKLNVRLSKHYYYIYLPLFNEYVVDIYAPIIEGDRV